MKRSALKYGVLFLFLMIMRAWSDSSDTLFPFAMPWSDTTNTFISFTNIPGLTPTPINASSAIFVNSAGHLATSSGRIRLWGANLVFTAGFPSNANAPIIAARLAKYGFNVVRFMSIDALASPNGIWPANLSDANPDRTLDANQLLLMDNFIYQLEKNGIYVDLTLLVGRPFDTNSSDGSGLDSSFSSITDLKVKAALGFFDPKILNLEKAYASALLNRTNSATGVAYKNDPGVAFIEINNENGMINSFKEGRYDTSTGGGLQNAPVYATELNTAWNNWLKTQYTSQSNLITAWAQSESTAPNMLLNGDFSSGSIQNWVLQLSGSPAAAATASVVNEGPETPPGLCAKIIVTSPGQADSDVQIFQTGVNIIQSNYYKLTFQARANGFSTMRAGCLMGQSPYNLIGLKKDFNLSSSWQTYSVTFQATASDANGRVNLTGFGLAQGTVWLSNIELQATDSTALGSTQVTNGNFTSGKTPWVYQLTGTATGAATVISSGGPTNNLNPNGAYMQLTVTQAASPAWYAQLYQVFQNIGGVTNEIDPSHIYTVTFQAMTTDTASHQMLASCTLGVSPWTTLGLNQTFNLTNTWTPYSVAFRPTATATKPRLTLGGLAGTTGTVCISNVQFQVGGVLPGLYPSENLYPASPATPTIQTFSRFYDQVRTPAALNDWYTFLRDTETAYWTNMKNYIKNSVQAQALVVGTIEQCSTPNIMAATMDAIDTHNYWTPPQFPATDWNASNWYTTNTPMVNNPTTSLPACVAMASVLNKPRVVSEFSTPVPNTYEADCAMLMAAYGGFQDVDALYCFQYNGENAYTNTNALTDYFDLDENSVKMASARSAALMFRRGDFSPANSTVVVPVSSALENSLLPNAPSWNPIDATSGGEQAQTGLIHEVRIAVDGQTWSPLSLPPGSTNATGPIFNSDTGQLTWDDTLPQAGVVTGNTPMTRMVAGFGGGNTYTLGSVTINPGTNMQNGYGVISLSALTSTNNSIESASQLLLTTLGCQENSISTVNSYSIYCTYNTPYPSNVPITAFPPLANTNITFGNVWGSGPLMVEGIPGSITLPFAASKVSVYALNNTGARINPPTPLPVTSVGTNLTQFTFNSTYTTLWYEIDVQP